MGQIQIENALTQQSITHTHAHTDTSTCTQPMRLVEALFSLFHFESVRISINSSFDLYCMGYGEPFPTCAFISMAHFSLTLSLSSMCFELYARGTCVRLLYVCLHTYNIHTSSSIVCSIYFVSSKALLFFVSVPISSVSLTLFFYFATFDFAICGFALKFQFLLLAESIYFDVVKINAAIYFALLSSLFITRT